MSKRDIDLVTIISSTSSELGKISTQTQQYFVSLAKDEIKKRLTSRGAKNIAKTLIEKLNEDETENEN